MKADEGSRTELLHIVARARRRWRLRLALHGAAVLLATASVAAIAGGLGVQRLSFSPSAITVARVALLVVLLALAVIYILLPQLRRADDARFALYLEEHEPSLEAALLSAIEADADALSPALLRRLTADAVARVHAVDDGRRVERRRLRIAASLLGGSAALLALLLGAGPAPLRQGVLALVTPWRSAEAATSFGLEVSPGDVTVPRGADLTITARPRGFSGGRLDLLMRTGGNASFERIPMTAPGDTAAFQAILFDLAQPAEYMVEAGGVRSRLFHVAVADLPYTRKLQLEYHFPSYTALPPRVVDDAGDVAALRGSTVRLRVWTTRPAPSGSILLGDGRAFPLTAAADGTLTGTLPVDRDGLYHLELLGPDRRPVTGSPQYTIDALEDRPPTVSIEKPGRDQSVTSVEEVFVQARASDDYGVGSLELVYRVNGGAEQAVRLYGSAAGAPLKDVSAGHTLYLEELGLQPGDLVAYYARAVDNRPGALTSAPPPGPGTTAPGRASSDMYFLQIRPFRKDYRSSDERGMPGSGGNQDAGQLSERQKQIIAATFNLLRDRPGLSAQDADEHRTTIALSQQRLREQVQTLTDRMKARGMADDSALAAIVALMPKAISEMSAAEGDLHAGRENDALPPEQRALQALQRAEALYRDVRVSMNDEQGGGGSASASASELADLFELEQDKLRNQYETVRRSQEEQTRSQLDATADRLRQLAQRQEAAAERQRRAAQQGQGGANGSSGAAGQAQRELAQQAEEEARRLERLARENPQQPQLEESARQLREAADAMRRAASDPSGAGAQAARDRLDAARRLLERDRTDRLAQGAGDAARRAQELAEEQHRIAVAASAASARQDQAQTRQLQEREDRLGTGVQDLEQRLDALASGAAASAAASDRESAGRLSAAAGMIRDRRIADKIRASRNVIGQRPDAAPYGERLQRDISADLDSVRQRVAAATRGTGADGKEQEAQRTLERAADLARGMESLGERMRQSAEDAQAGGARAERSERAANGQQTGPGQQSGQQSGSNAQMGTQQGQQGAQGQQGQRGQQAQSGQRGQQGQQGSQGQQGQQGSQGQGGQGGQRGQQGQQAAAAQGNGQGQPGQSRQAGTRTTGIPGGAGGGDANPPAGGMRLGAIPQADARQFQAEARQRLAEAEALRRDLAAQGRPTQELDDLINRLSAMASNRPYSDPAALQQLQDAAVEGAKRLEFALRGELRQDARDQVLLSGSAAVPEAYRRLVEQYFKSLSETRDR